MEDELTTRLILGIMRSKQTVAMDGTLSNMILDDLQYVSITLICEVQESCCFLLAKNLVFSLTLEVQILSDGFLCKVPDTMSST